MKTPYTVFFFINFLLFAFTIKGQPHVTDEGTVGADAPSFIGVTILSNPSLSVRTVSEYQNGVSIDHNTLQLSVSLGLTWSLQIRATDDLRYSTNSIPASSIGIKSLNLGNSPEIFLSTTNQTLASGLASSLLNVAMLIRYRAIGGPGLLKPAGAYTTTLVFTYTAN